MPNGRLSKISKKYRKKLEEIDIDKEVDKLYSKFETILLVVGGDITDCDIQFSISIDRLKVLVQSYYLDVFRYCDFHPYDEADKSLNRFKRSAIFTKWFLKIQPVATVSMSNDKGSSFALQVNEHIALIFSIMMVKADISLVSSNTRDRIIYAFYYREYSDSLYTFLLESWYQSKVLSLELEQVQLSLKAS